MGKYTRSATKNEARRNLDREYAESLVALSDDELVAERQKWAKNYYFSPDSPTAIHNRNRLAAVEHEQHMRKAGI